MFITPKTSIFFATSIKCPCPKIIQGHRRKGFGPPWSYTGPSAQNPLLRCPWRWGNTCSHSEHRSQAHQRRLYCHKWETSTAPNYTNNPPNRRVFVIIRWFVISTCCSVIPAADNPTKWARRISLLILLRVRRGHLVWNRPNYTATSGKLARRRNWQNTDNLL